MILEDVTVSRAGIGDVVTDVTDTSPLCKISVMRSDLEKYSIRHRVTDI